MSERDLASAIYAEITCDASVAMALDARRHDFGEPFDDARHMRLVLSIAAANAIEVVLARRQREAARAEPMSHPNRDAIARVLHEAHKPWCDYTYPFEHPMSSREVYEALADAALRWVCAHEAARTGPWDGSMLAGTNPGDTPAKTGGTP